MLSILRRSPALAFLALFSLLVACGGSEGAAPGIDVLPTDADDVATPQLPDALGGDGSGPLDVGPGDIGPDDTMVADVLAPADTPPTPDDVPVTAPRCAVVLEPLPLDFLVVPNGTSVDRGVRIRSVGTGRCGFDSARVSGCVASDGMQSGWACPTDEPSEWFQVVSAPEQSADGIEPGATADLSVRFTPPAQAPETGESVEFAGWLQLTLNDPYVPAGGDTRFEVPELPPGPAAPNLIGRTGDGALVAVPSEIVFGDVTVGCAAEPRAVEIRALGSMVALLYGVGLAADCPAGVTLDVPPILDRGREVSAGDPLPLSVRFTPLEVGALDCDIEVYNVDATAPVLHVPLRGGGVAAPHHTDAFVGGVAAVDVLFVLDDSGSMCLAQERLQDSLAAMVGPLQTNAVDARIGAVSVCVDPPASCPSAGELLPALYEAPQWRRWVDAASLDQLPAYLDIGCQGGGSAAEAGLEAARLALSSPRLSLSATACAADADCDTPDRCLRDLGLCGGSNGGFLREDADLHVVVLSDEDDQSPLDQEDYVTFLQGLGGRLHAIIGDAPGGCDDGAVAGAHGARYEFVSAATGGRSGSICAADYEDVLRAVVEELSAPRTVFPLEDPANPAGIVVTVDGARCDDGWTYRLEDNAVVFDRDGPCMPGGGDPIVVEYDAACL